MSNGHTQLKEEQPVGNEVVLRDINPKTITSAVEDERTGTPMNQTLDRIWNSINNKLSRVVNSVNGRTGVVTLTAKDVGLGNVDNVSTSDIKKWVINKLTEEFGNKRIKLFHSLQDVDDLVAVNDLTNQNAAYYTETGYGNDSKSYIGYIYLDSGTNQLAHTYSAIKVVGFTDNSLLYDEAINGHDLSGGGLGVHIWRYEDALEVYEGISKVESGLRLNKDKIVANVYQFDGVYGDGTTTDTNALLYYDTASIPATAKDVRIFINDNQLNLGLKLRKEGLKIGDLILCNFKDYRTNNIAPTGMQTALMCRNTALGRVNAVPTTTVGVDYYRIDFYSIRQNVGWGIQSIEDHRTDAATDTELGIKLGTGGVGPAQSVTGNQSGLQVFRGKTDMDPFNGANDMIPKNVRATVYPTGIWFNDTYTGGIRIVPDMSLCMIPYAGFGEGNVTGETYTDPDGMTRPYGSKVIGNYSVYESRDYSDPSTLNDATLQNGTVSDGSLIGINLMKGTYMDPNDSSSRHGAYCNAINLSGLRLDRTRNSTTTIPSQTNICSDAWFGMNHGELTERYGTTINPSFFTVASGGLSINIGKFLEIDPLSVPDNADNFYNQSGKINVRLGKGLEPEPDEFDENDNRIAGNRIQVALASGGGLSFDANGKLMMNGAVSAAAPVLNKLRFIDHYNTEFTFNPLPVPNESQSTTTVTLGSGLKITL